MAKKVWWIFFFAFDMMKFCSFKYMLIYLCLSNFLQWAVFSCWILLPWSLYLFMEDGRGFVPSSIFFVNDANKNRRVSLLEQFHVGLNFNSEFKFKQCSSQDWFGSHFLCYAASMINRISCDSNSRNSEVQQLTSDAFIEVGLAYWWLQLQHKNKQMTIYFSICFLCFPLVA